MATTREILNVQSSHLEDVPICRPDFPSWEQIDPRTVKDGTETVYQLMDATGDPQYPGIIRLGAYKNKAGQDSFSGRFTTYVKVTDDNDEITYHPIEYVIARKSEDGVNGGESGDIAAFTNLAIFAGFINALTTPVKQATPADRDSTISNRRKFSITNFDPGDMDGPATS